MNITSRKIDFKEREKFFIKLHELYKNKESILFFNLYEKYRKELNNNYNIYIAAKNNNITDYNYK